MLLCFGYHSTTIEYKANNAEQTRHVYFEINKNTLKLDTFILSIRLIDYLLKPILKFHLNIFGHGHPTLLQFAKDSINNTNRIIYRVHYDTMFIHEGLTQKILVCYSHEQVLDFCANSLRCLPRNVRLNILDT